MQNLGNMMIDKIPGNHPLTKFASFSVITSCVMFALFQKHMLSERISRVVSKVMFYPTLPLTYLQRIGNLFTPIDDTVVLGVAPLAILSHPEEMHAMGVRGLIFI